MIPILLPLLIVGALLLEAWLERPGRERNAEIARLVRASIYKESHPKPKWNRAYTLAGNQKARYR